MKRNTAREWTVEEFDEWHAATKKFEAVAEAADEAGGPSLSLVPATERHEVWPTDLLPPAAPEPSDGGEPGAEGAAEPPIAAMPFDGVELPDSRKRGDGGADPHAAARESFPRLLDGLSDTLPE